MGIKSLTSIIKKYSPESIVHTNLYTLEGNTIAIDGSLFIYQSLLNNNSIMKNKDGKITNHIVGLFYKLLNMLSYNIKILFIFDGKPPDMKSDCLNKRKIKLEQTKCKLLDKKEEGSKNKYDKLSLKINDEVISDVKKLLTLMGIDYYHPIVGEAEAVASELCRRKIVDYVYTEDMDSLVYGCPKLIRNCVDSKFKRTGIVSIFDLDKTLKNLNFNMDQFISFSILSGCDYCNNIPKLGSVTAYKLINKYNNIDNIIHNNKKFNIPDNYLNIHKKSIDIFKSYYNLNINESDFKKYNKFSRITNIFNRYYWNEQ